MRKVIFIQLLRIALVYAVLAGLTAWQTHFIVSGIQSNPLLNALIIGVLGFGSIIAVRALLGLRNDVTAFAALKSVYDDVQQDRLDPQADRRSRLQRCAAPGIVYASPSLLGHVFDLTLEELLRTKHMRISVATMQHLLGAIDNRMAHQRSLMNYLTGLSVFLGLIGTFIGLLEMVGSVGGIIGGLAQSDSASPDAIKRLIHDLEAPLTGMATGFSCSLFGLFTSLTLGLFARFGNTAAHAVKDEFESWLADIAHIETHQNAIAGDEAGLTQPGSRHGVPVELAAAVLRSGEALEQMVGAMRRVVERQDLHAQLMERSCRLLDRAANSDNVALDALQRTAALQDELGRLRADFARHLSSLRHDVGAGFEQLGRIAREQHADVQESLAAAAGAQEHARVMLRQIQADAAGRADQPLVAGAVASAVAAGVGDVASAVDAALRQVGHELARLAEEQRATTAVMAGLATPDLTGEIRELGRSLQDGLGSGLSEVARSFEQAFSAHAVLLRETTALHRQSQPQATPRLTFGVKKDRHSWA